MELGIKIRINTKIGTLIKTEGTYGLIKFDNCQAVFNLSKIPVKNIINDTD